MSKLQTYLNQIDAEFAVFRDQVQARVRVEAATEPNIPVNHDGLSIVTSMNELRARFDEIEAHLDATSAAGLNTSGGPAQPIVAPAEEDEFDTAS